MKVIKSFSDVNLIGDTFIRLEGWNDCVGFGHSLSKRLGEQINGKEFTIDFKYPFEKGMTKKFKIELNYRESDGTYGLWANDIIDFISDSIASMYEETTEKDIPNLINKEVTSPKYGKSIHVFGDLVLEYLTLDVKNKRIVYYVGS